MLAKNNLIWYKGVRDISCYGIMWCRCIASVSGTFLVLNRANESKQWPDLTSVWLNAVGIAVYCDTIQCRLSISLISAIWVEVSESCDIPRCQRTVSNIALKLVFHYPPDGFSPKKTVPVNVVGHNRWKLSMQAQMTMSLFSFTTANGHQVLQSHYQNMYNRFTFGIVTKIRHLTSFAIRVCRPGTKFINSTSVCNVLNCCAVQLSGSFTASDNIAVDRNEVAHCQSLVGWLVHNLNWNLQES